MKLNKKIKTSISLAALAGLSLSANAAVMSFGDMNTIGGDGVAGSGNTVYLSPAMELHWDLSPALKGGDDDSGQFWLAVASLTGTSNGDKVAAGDYTIDFTYDYHAGSGQNLVVDVLALDDTPLGTKDFGSVDANNGPASVAFSVSSGSTAIGQDFKLRFSNTGGGYMMFDNITGDFTAAVPEPSTTALLGLGGLALILRRRK
jgi:hypothetical protein